MPTAFVRLPVDGDDQGALGGDDAPGGAVADLGQVEPRVLAAVSRDEAFAAATREDDLYAPVAQRLGVERSVAKIAVLAAMYGQRSGAAGLPFAADGRARYPDRV